MRLLKYLLPKKKENIDETQTHGPSSCVNWKEKNESCTLEAFSSTLGLIESFTNGLELLQPISLCEQILMYGPRTSTCTE